MSRAALLFVYILFFFLYFFGAGLLGNANAGLPYPWREKFGAFNLTYYAYTLLTVLVTHFIVFRKYYYARPRWKLWVALLVLLIIFILFRYLLEEVMMPVFVGKGNYNPATTFRFYIFDNVYFGFTKIFIGFVLFLFDELLRNQQQKAALLQQKKEAELNFLQAQMNPHFLFNSLNNLYSLAYEQHPQTAGSILKLSDMMRYVTYEKDKKAELSKELEYVRNLIDIQQLRHDYKLNVEIDAAPGILSCKVIPLLLIPLVENALKHGDLSDPSIPMTISLQAKQHTLEVTVTNKMAPPQTGAAGGVGLKNLQRRLELTYRPGDYFFNAAQKGNIFSVKIITPLA